MSNLAEQFDYYTYADMEQWDDDVKCELHDGELVMMAPASVWHQRLVLNLASQLKDFLKDKKCEAFIDIGVRLFPEKDKNDDILYIPDIIVVCDENKLDNKTCNGAPDLVIEVTSQNTAFYDKHAKKSNYFLAGVKEYWIVDRDHMIKYVKSDTASTGYEKHLFLLSEPGMKVSVDVLDGFELVVS